MLKRFVLGLLACLSLTIPLASATPLEAAVSPAWTTLNTSVFGGETIFDIAASPSYAQDKTLFVITYTPPPSLSYSLWRTQNGALTWQKMFTAASGVYLYYVELSPDYGKTAQVVYVISDAGGVNPMLLRSSDAGANWSPRPAPAGTANGNPMAVASDAIVFLAAYDGLAGQETLYSSSSGGIFFTPGVPVGNVPLTSLAVSPSYASDQTILAGNSNGAVLWSNDGGASVRLVSAVILSGNMQVAFDNNFATNRTVYALSDADGGGIYRTNVGAGQPWQRLDTSFSSTETLGALTISSTGVLYASSSRGLNTPPTTDGGLYRCINPVSPAVIERVNTGLSDLTTLTPGVFPCVGNQLWALDTYNNRILTFVDTLSQPVQLVAPANNLPAGTFGGGAVTAVSLNWQLLEGASTYQWQLSSTSNFSVIPTGFSGVSAATQVQAPPLDPTSVYYWRVRAYAPMYSPWSPVWSFTTPSPPVQIGAPQLISPVAAGTDIAPLFRWSAIPGATGGDNGYEFEVSKSSDFTSLVISKKGSQKLSANSWQSSVQLEYATAYYWHVRAITGAGTGPWSSAGIFVTVNAPAATVTVTSTSVTTTPPPPPSQTTGLFPTTSTSLPQTATVTVTAQLPATSSTSASAPPVIPQIPAATPDWVYYAIVGGGMAMVLLVAVVLLLRGPRPPRLL